MARVVTAGGRSAVSPTARVELFLVGRLTGISVSPATPAIGEPATITVTGNENPCSGAILYFGDGTFEAWQNLPYAGPLSLQPLVGTRTWSEAGPKVVTAKGELGNRCRGTVSTTITVRGPQVTLTAPSAGATFIKPADIPLTADASDESGQAITRVEFYADGTLLHTDTSAPYAFTWSGAPLGTHALLAKVVNAAGVVGASAPLTVHVEPPPLILSVNPASPVATISAELRIEGLPNCGTIGLDFGDGTEDTFLGVAGQPIIGHHAWATPGTKTITAFGHGAECQSRGTLTITVGPAPAFAVTANPGSPVAGSPASVTVTGPGPCTTVVVGFGDGTSHTFTGGTSPPLTTPHTWASAGTRTVTAAGQGSACNLQASTSVVVQPPAAPLTLNVTPTSPVAGTAAQVSVNAPSTCTAVTVNYGDGSSQTFNKGVGWPAANAHTWATSGTKTVTATGATGICPSPTSITVTVQAPPPPPLTITVSPASPTAGVPANVTITGPAACTTVNVFFGDGTSQTFMGGSGPPLTNAHTWSSAGAKTITAQGLGDQCNLAGSKSITVLTPPSVSITAPGAGTTYTVPATIAMAASAAPAQGSITKVDFYANGALVATDTVAPYAFSWSGVGAGTYALVAKATDSAGAVGTSNAVSVIVGSPPPSTVFGINVSPHPVGAGQAATITVTGTNPCGMLWMDFGDGAWWIAPISGGLPFTTTHVWAAPGTYTVLARGFVDCGGEVTRSVTVTGAPAPDPEAVADPPASVSAFEFTLESEDPLSEGSAAWVDEISYAREAPAVPATLNVTLMGTGGGTVTSSPAGLSCTGAIGQTCSAAFQVGDVVTLHQAATTGTFTGWGGACSGLGACTVTLSPATLVVAHFTVPPPMVTKYSTWTWSGRCGARSRLPAGGAG